MINSILKKIVIDKISWIKDRKKKEPLDKFQNFLKKSERNFYSSLSRKKPNFILEYKKKSPSLGILNKYLSISKISEIYKKYANSISVLTDEKYFLGKFEYLNIIRKNVSQPILCKDFFIDPYQIYLARYYGADAVLLMLSILNDHQYLFLSDLAKKLNMGILTEIHDKKELNRAIYLKAKIIGINNRNLNDLSVNINKTKELAPLIPKNIITISESGINDYSQIRKLSKIVDGFLIGTSLMKSNNLNLDIRKLILGNNKICGLTNLKDAKKVKNSGAIYGGLIFCPYSKRKISINTAKILTNSINFNYVGVFQNSSMDFILSVIKKVTLKAIQLHGDENQEYISSLRKKIPKNIAIWKVYSISKKFPSLNLKNVDYYLFDNLNGGSGKTFDWSIVKNKKLGKVLLSGGINKNNCLSASKLGFCGLDFNSGVEKKIGIKSNKKIKSVFKILRNYS
ncbi:bifunctional indole-3-glycerol-phosphate synthase TrpC/phosphoribosylanthranilate isomerase TrpF [Buchnera aphidicola (Mindarus keteleerifoliae)]|uniref:bifunctional indole-3-glycerol-phosphate synthase TrpC/phosphoribosylanthranilate isomerase TrpF n=1 Tax=Buchnera aphidicola TaxID=9 RepID=UPI0031B6B24A